MCSSDLTIATLRDAASGKILSEAFHLPERRIGERHELGLTVGIERAGYGWQLVIEAQRFARFVHINDANYRAAHDWFHLAPNRPCIVPLIPLAPNASQSAVVARASNVAFKADATNAAPAGEVLALNAASPTFYG